MSLPRHLLIDGSNIVHAWPELRGLVKRDRDAARAQLVRRLAPIHDMERVRITVVFDGRGTELTIERPAEQLTLSVVYTPSSLSADDVIEQMVTGMTDAEGCIVATDDLAERSMVVAARASAMTSTELAAWAKRAEDRQRVSVKNLRDVNQREWQQP